VTTNALLVTRSLTKGKVSEVSTHFNVMSLSSGRDLLLSEGVMRTRIDYYPIRFQERTLTFTTAFPENRAQVFEDLKSAILGHYTYALSRGRSVFMRLSVVLDGGTRSYLGVIESIPVEIDRFSVVRKVDFTMKLQSKRENSISELEDSARNSPYVPGVKDVQRGTEWWDQRPPTSTVPSRSLLRKR